MKILQICPLPQTVQIDPMNATGFWRYALALVETYAGNEIRWVDANPSTGEIKIEEAHYHD